MNNKLSIKDASLDAFLGGKIFLYQPLDGYRATTDSILLAASVDAKKGQRVLELGCGVGAVIFSLMNRIPGLSVVGIEAQKRYARLAVHNASHNCFKAEIIQCDFNSIPQIYKNAHYDYVLLNPPFFSKQSVKLRNFSKDIAKRESIHSLDDWINTAIKRCAVKGEIIIIHQVERLSQILKSFDEKIGDVKILPIASFRGENAKRILVKGKKGSASPLKILPPLVLHELSNAEKSKKKYTEQVEGILRNGNALDWQ